MYKPIVYSLLVLGYLAFSTLPFTEVSAQTITKTSSGESGGPGESFAVDFSITGITGSSTLSVAWFGGDIQASFNQTGPFRDFAHESSGGAVTQTISGTGTYTVYLKVKPTNQLTYYTGTWQIEVAVGTTTKSFDGKITGILYFPSASTTRSVAEDAVVGAPLGPPISAIYPKRIDDTLNVDGDPNTNINVWYVLEGTDKDSFDIDRNTGQLRVKTPLDYDIKSTYSVTVRVNLQRATRPDLISNSDTIAVRINVNDPPIEAQPPPKRRVIQDCPVGWVRSDGFAGRNRRVLIYEVNVEMDMQDRVSIYKPVWVAIYVHPDEGLENLDGWKLRVALPYNHHREYLLTAENSVVVDAGFVEGGFAFIANPEENPFPMVGVGFTGSPAPGFDYRLYDETGKRVDFGISCYKRGDIFQVLQTMEDPRVLRQVLLESFDWDAHYLRSEWTVPTPAPAAPSLVKKSGVGTWADLKKQ